MKKIAAGEFKAKCLKLMDQVQKSGEEFIITKFGQAVAKLGPVVNTNTKPLFGRLKGRVVIKGDIVAGLEDRWDADE